MLSEYKRALVGWLDDEIAKLNDTVGKRSCKTLDDYTYQCGIRIGLERARTQVEVLFRKIEED